MNRILLVDDQAHVLRVIKLSLERSGYEVDTASGGDAALAMLKGMAGGAHAIRPGKFDVVIADIDMPGMNGIQFCEAMHRDFPTSAPLLFLTGSGKEKQLTGQLANALANYPGTEFLQKPMSLNWLLSRLDEYAGCAGEAGESGEKFARVALG